MTRTIDIEGMGCGMCVKKVTAVLEALEGVEGVQVSLENNNAIVAGSAPEEALKAAVESKGFRVKGIS